MIDWDSLKEGDIIFHFSLHKFAGRILEFHYGKLKIININQKSIRFETLDENDCKTNMHTVKKDLLVEQVNSYGLSYEELTDAYRPYMKKLSEIAEKNLEGFTDKHPDYGYYIYIRDILKDFDELLEEGFTEERYHKIKDKYHDIEEMQFKKAMGL